MISAFQEWPQVPKDGTSCQEFVALVQWNCKAGRQDHVETEQAQIRLPYLEGIHPVTSRYLLHMCSNLNP